MRTYSLTFQLMKMTYKPFARPSDDNEGCPVCDGLGGGPYRCPNCGRRVMDFDYFKSLKKMEEKYGTDDLHKLSCEKLTFKEIVAIRTFIMRADHHFGDDDFSDKCSDDGLFSNLSRRLGELEEEYCE